VKPPTSSSVSDEKRVGFLHLSSAVRDPGGLLRSLSLGNLFTPVLRNDPFERW
jgi:hypothetical protein